MACSLLPELIESTRANVEALTDGSRIRLSPKNDGSGATVAAVVHNCSRNEFYTSKYTQNALRTPTSSSVKREKALHGLCLFLSSAGTA